MLFKGDDLDIGEDWSEKIACEICRLLGIPHAHYEMACIIGSQSFGVVCESIVREKQILIHGNELLYNLGDNYPDKNVLLKPRDVKEYSVDCVQNVLTQCDDLPIDWWDNLPEGIASTLDVFIGYIMLDALIGNCDRHHENWGVLADEQYLFLAPTFDHGAC